MAPYESDTAEEIADLIGSRGVDMSVEQIQDPWLKDI